MLDLQLSLPFPEGSTQTYNGPHGPNDNAVDFYGKPGDVTAARDGVARLICGGAMVVVDHGDGWSTEYMHLSKIPAGLNGSKVTRGQVLGKQSNAVGNCGTSSGPHVHFGLRKNNVQYPIDGLVIGGWVIEAGKSSYEGCLRQLSTGERRCSEDNGDKATVTNTGVIGRG